MNHLGTKTIQTARLELRRFTADDAEAMYRNWASDPEVTKYLTWPHHTGADVSRTVLIDWVAGYQRRDFYQWAIVPHGMIEPIGSIAVVEYDDRVQKAHIGYCIGQNWWHKGYMSEALSAVMRYLFEEVGFMRIEARHDPNNPYSGQVMLKCGMRFEGMMRRSDWNNQGICDASCYAILQDEWQALLLEKRTW